MPPSILITAGPTHEPIDAVRYIANRSSGRMGLALAAAATSGGRGWPTTLLLGPVCAQPQESSLLRIARFRTAADLQGLMREHWPRHDVLLMAAAVADYTVAEIRGQESEDRGQKSEGSAAGGNTRADDPSAEVIDQRSEVRGQKSEDAAAGDNPCGGDQRPSIATQISDLSPAKLRRGEAPLLLELVPTPDLLAEAAALRQPHQIVIGFALQPAETLLDSAREKMLRKGAGRGGRGGLDAIVANPLETMDSEHVSATLLLRDGTSRTAPARLAKPAFAEWLLREIEQLRQNGRD